MTTECAFKYLLEEKNKQKKICNIKYDKLQIQDYLLIENENTKMAKLIFKARSRTLDIKCFKTWKYNDLTCTGCNVNEETEIEILKCEGFGVTKVDMKYDVFFGNSATDMFQVAKYLKQRLRTREKLVERIT